MADTSIRELQQLHKYSDEQTKVLDVLEEEARLLFPPSLASSFNEYYKDKSALKERVEAWSNAKGALTSFQGHGFECKRATQPASFKIRTEKTRIKNNIPLGHQRERKSMRCGCKFVIRFSNATKRAIAAGVPPEAVRVTEGSYYRHTNGCFPSQCQLIVDKKSSGKYQDKAKGAALKDIIAVLRPGRDVPCVLLRDMMRPLYPLTYAITSGCVTNMRNKVKKLLAKEEPNIDTSQEEISDSTAELLLCTKGDSLQPGEDNQFGTPLDEVPAEFLPAASQCAREILKVCLDSGNDTAVIEAYLQKLHDADPSFTFRIARASDGSACGYVWQTSTMRADWEDYGNVLFLDAMKRQLNSIFWPYIGPCILDGYGRVAVVAESICIAERIVAYAWIMRMLASMGPRRQLSRVSVIYGDGIFAGEGLLKELDLEETCKICQDTFHLLSATNGVWPKFFGVHNWPRFSDDFRQLVYSYTKKDYITKYECLKERLATNSKWLEYLETSVHGHRHQFVRFYVQQYSFNLGKQGSSAAEANHSSYVARIGPVSVEQPAVQVRNTLERHSDICKERNELIVRYSSECIATATARPMELQDKKALLALSSWGYELWQEQLKESVNYSCIGRDKYNKVVRRNGMTDGGRKVGDGSKCDCIHRKSFSGQCCHLISANSGKFVLALWEKHWLQRKLLRCADALEGGGRLEVQEVENDGDVNMSQQPLRCADALEGGGRLEVQQVEDDGDVNMSQQPVGEDDDSDARLDSGGCDDASEGGGRLEAENFEDDGDVSMSQQTVEGEDEESLDETPPLADSKSITFGDVMAICQDLASCILKSKDIPTQVGMLLHQRDNLRSVPQITNSLEAVDFEEIFNVHFSAFTCHKSSRNDLFTATQSENGVLQAPPLKSQGPSRRLGGAPPKKRRKPAEEMILRGIRIPGTRKPLADSRNRKSKCSFCCLTGHSRGQAKCDAFTALKSTFLRYDEDFQKWSKRLGDPRLHLVEWPSPLQIRSFEKVNWDAAIPREVHHVLLVGCFYSKAHVEYKSVRQSQYREIGKNDVTPPSMEFNVVEVVLLVQGAGRYESLGSPCYMLVNTVREWIVKNFRKSSSKRSVLNSIRKAALNDTTNTY